MRDGRSRPVRPKKCLIIGFPKPGQINPGIYGESHRFSAAGAFALSLALGNPDQTIASDDKTFGGFGDVAQGDQLRQMRRGYYRGGRGDRNLDQRGELFGRQKLWRVHGHR
jgi:hypothetical protein